MDSLFLIINLLGGLGIFLFGMKIMGDGLENLAGEKLKGIFDKITSNPLKGVATGAIVTAIIQSSSAVTVMVVGFVNAGIMNLSQAAYVIMGANIGTTITAQLITFDFDAIIPVFIAIGAFLVLFTKKKNPKELGHIILGFGILFLGLILMSDAMAPLRESPVFTKLILSLKGHTFLSLFLGIGMTAIIQSSSAVTGILVALASVGSLPIDVAIPMLYGTNIGTCVTALISCLGTTKTAKKAALIHLSFNVIGSMIFLIPPISNLLLNVVTTITPGATGEVVSRQIANAHTIFNVVNTILILPFTKYLVALVNFILPGEDEKEITGVKYIDDRLLETPTIAFGQATNEIIRMGTLAKENLESALKGFTDNNQDSIDRVYKNEALINLLETDITRYLVKLSNSDIGDEQRTTIAAYFHVVNDIERIGDHAENIADLAKDKLSKNVKFSKDAIEELKVMVNTCIEALDHSIECFSDYSDKKALDVRGLEDKIDLLEKDLKVSHIKRLNSGSCDAIVGTIFLDLISNLERVGDHAVNIAEILSQA
ncbi:Na/Pi cotransporter family protein [uncultured Clostridium sp.]|uniref:Na/Pi cotransporter family protein n=1 Tax=uncultured Clostridium sp. TaxID=59620 RepID=UPI003217A12B